MKDKNILLKICSIIMIIAGITVIVVVMRYKDYLHALIGKGGMTMVWLFGIPMLFYIISGLITFVYSELKSEGLRITSIIFNVISFVVNLIYIYIFIIKNIVNLIGEDLLLHNLAISGTIIIYALPALTNLIKLIKKKA